MFGHRFWIWLWIALGVFLVVRSTPRDRGVITDHIEFGRRLLAGDDLYAPYLDVDDQGRPKALHAPYPPSFGLLTAPFSLVPEGVARFGWVTLQVLALWLIGLRLRDLLLQMRPDLRPKVHLLLFLTALVGSRYLLRDTHGGGGNLFNVAMALQSLHLAAKGHDKRAGFVLGFSLATKPTQALFLLLLVLLRHRGAALWTILATIFFVALALWIHRGVEHWPYWLQGTIAYARQQDLFAEPRHGFPEFTWMNQCLRCMVARFFGEVPPEYAATVPYFFQGFGLRPASTALLATVLNVMLLLWASCTAFRVSAGGRAAAARLPIVAAFLALSLLVSPITWRAHHVALLPGLLLVVTYALEGRRGMRGFLLAYVVLCLAGEELTGKALKNTQSSLYLVTLGTLAVFLLCLRFARAPLPAAFPRR